MMADSDTSLIARIVTDDDRLAFELLVRRYQSPLRGFLRRLVRNDAARADDLAQDTFIKLYRSIASFKGQAKFTTWLYRVAYNIYLNDQRSRAAKVAFDEAYHEPAPDTAISVGDAMDLEVALQQLPDRQRAVFDLHYKKGMTHHEVANALEMPLGTVKTDLSRGLEILRSFIGGQDKD